MGITMDGKIFVPPEVDDFWEVFFKGVKANDT